MTTSQRIPGGSQEGLAWSQLLLIAAAPLTAFAAMVNFSPVLPQVRDELGLTNTWVGILASATLLTHTLVQLPGGQITDAIGGRRALTLAVALVGVSLIAAGLAPSFPLLLLARTILGIGTGLSFIAGIAFVHHLASPDRRVVSQGIFGASGNLGVLLVLLLFERLAGVVGWRGAFLIEGGLAVAAAGLMSARLLPGPRRTGVVYPSWGETFANTNLWLLGLAHVLTYGVYVALTTWSTTFLWQRHGVGLEWAGPLAALMAVSAVLGRILGGTLSVGRERTVMLVSCAGAALFTVLFPLMPDLASSLVALLGLGWFASMPFGAVFSYIGKVSSSRVAGRGLAVINFVGNIGAFAFPPLVGYALDLSGSFILGFGVVALVGLVGTLVLMVRLPRPEAKP